MPQAYETAQSVGTQSVERWTCGWRGDATARNIVAADSSNVYRPLFLLRPVSV